MMNGKAVIPLVAGLCIGGFALKLVFDTVKKAKGAQPDVAAVWTAKTDIPLGTAIDETMIAPAKFPKDAVPQGAFSKKEKLIGRVTRVVSVAGSPLLEGMMHPEGTPPGLWVKPGYRAVAVKIDESSGVSNHLWPGCYVDVIGYFTVRKNGRQETVARTIIEDIEVGAVGARISAVDTTDPAEKKKAQPARAVTLFVKPDQVPILHLAEQRGKIKLSMRNSTDEVIESDAKKLVVNDSFITGDDEAEGDENKPNMLGGLFSKFFAQAEPAPAAPVAPVIAPPPPPAPQPGWVVRIVRGDEVEEIAWKDARSRERFVAPAAQNTPQNSSFPGIQPASDSHDDIVDDSDDGVAEPIE